MERIIQTYELAKTDGSLTGIIIAAALVASLYYIGKLNTQKETSNV